MVNVLKIRGELIANPFSVQTMENACQCLNDGLFEDLSIVHIRNLEDSFNRKKNNPHHSF